MDIIQAVKDKVRLQKLLDKANMRETRYELLSRSTSVIQDGLRQSKDHIDTAQSYRLKIIETRMQGLDMALDILKNTLSISLTGWVAVLAVPNVNNVASVIGITKFIFFSSVVLIVVVFIWRFKLETSKVNSFTENQNRNLEDAREVLDDVKKQQDHIKIEFETLSSEQQNDIREILQHQIVE